MKNDLSKVFEQGLHILILRLVPSPVQNLMLLCKRSLVLKRNDQTTSHVHDIREKETKAKHNGGEVERIPHAFSFLFPPCKTIYCAQG